MGMAETQVLEPLTAASWDVHYQEAKLEAEEPVLEPGTLLWDTRTPRNGQLTENLK